MIIKLISLGHVLSWQRGNNNVEQLPKTKGRTAGGFSQKAVPAQHHQQMGKVLTCARACLQVPSSRSVEHRGWDCKVEQKAACWASPACPSWCEPPRACAFHPWWFTHITRTQSTQHHCTAPARASWRLFPAIRVNSKLRYKTEIIFIAKHSEQVESLNEDITGGTTVRLRTLHAPCNAWLGNVWEPHLQHLPGCYKAAV